MSLGDVIIRSLREEPLMNDIARRCIETWNATDLERREELLDAYWAEDCVYVDPLAEVSGRAEISTTISAVQEQFPGFVFSQIGEANTHHQQTCFRWGLGPTGEEPVVIGFDVVVTDEHQRIRDVRGFFDQVPEPLNTSTVPAYAFALIADVQVNEELFDYMEAVERTMHRFHGRWLSHGRTSEVHEGHLPGDLVIMEFPDLAAARAWYRSDEYQAIIPLRTRNCHGVVAITEGVTAAYSTQDTIRSMRAVAAS